MPFPCSESCIVFSASLCAYMGWGSSHCQLKWTILGDSREGGHQGEVGWGRSPRWGWVLCWPRSWPIMRLKARLNCALNGFQSGDLLWPTPWEWPLVSTESHHMFGPMTFCDLSHWEWSNGCVILFSFLFDLFIVCQKAMTSNAMLWWSLLFTDVAQTEKQRTALDDCVVLWSLAPHLTQRYRTDYRALARVTMQQCSHTKCTTLSIIMFNHTAIYA